MTRMEKQIQFIIEIEKLKAVKRQNYTIDNLRPENSAEHSWHVAVMALILDDQIKNIDKQKVITMLLVHDLAEIYTGDISVFDDEMRSSAAENEEKALARLLKKLPHDQQMEIMETWKEFEYGDSSEAKYARSLDALQPLIMHAEIAPEGCNPGNLNPNQVRGKKLFIKNDVPAMWPFVEKAIQKSIEKELYT